MAVTTGLGVSLTNAPVVVGDSYDSYCDGCSFFAAVQPVLQAQDGSFIGTVAVAYDNNNPLTDMASFDQTGAIRWMVPGNYQPQIATADGGLIATDPSGAAITFDQNGNATDVEASFTTQSWTENTYELGSTKQVLLMPKAVATPPFSSFAGANQSGNGTSPLCHDGAISSSPSTAVSSFWTNRTISHGRASPQTALSLPIRRTRLTSSSLK